MLVLSGDNQTVVDSHSKMLSLVWIEREFRLHLQGSQRSPFQYEHFSLHLPRSEILSERLIAMFHRSTVQLNKAHVLKEFPKMTVFSE
jgi:hypothetical protein